MSEARYTPYAYVGPNGVCCRVYNIGSQTFDAIWRQAPDDTTHIVMQTHDHSWIVTDRFKGHLTEDAHIQLRHYQTCDTFEEAMMVAMMEASRGEE